MSKQEEGTNKESVKKHSPNSIPKEIIENLDPEDQESVVRRMFQMTVEKSFGPLMSPFMEKIGEKLTSAHVTALIKNDENESIRIAEEKTQVRKYNFKILLAVFSFIFILCIFFTLTGNNETLFKLIEILVPIAGAGLFGYGYALAKRKQ